VLKVVGHVVSTVVAFSGSTWSPCFSGSITFHGHGLGVKASSEEEDLFGLVNVISFLLKEDLASV
jgi:hypothetical protein